MASARGLPLTRLRSSPGETSARRCGIGLLLVHQDAIHVHEEAWKRAASGHRGPAGVSQTVARGGRVTRAEAGWPAQSISSASTTPMAGTPEPP
jgi:hypothetical protein